MARVMKDSGIEWIGLIPEDWEVIRLNNICSSIFLGQTPVYSEDENNNYIVGQKNNQSIGIDLSGIKYGERKFYTERRKEEFLLYGDILLNTLGGGSVGRIGYWDIEDNNRYLTDGHLMVIRPDESKSRNRYLFYLLCSAQKRLEDDAVGSTNQAFLTVRQIYKRKLAYPSIEEQQIIADYLDDKCVSVDAVIEKTKKSIEEYRKLKQAIITQAVTKGIRPNRKMKDSGIEWIGEIPEEWSLTRVKWILEERREKSKTGEEEPLSMSQKYGIIPTKEMDAIPNMASSFVGAKIVYKGDLVFNKLKAHLGVFSVSSYDGLVSPDYAVYFARNKVNLSFVEYLFKTPQYINEFKKKSTGVGAGLTRLYTDELFTIHIGLPDFEEQTEISDYLIEKITEMNSLIFKKEEYLSELEVLKKTMIYEYVTGKKEVK